MIIVPSQQHDLVLSSEFHTNGVSEISPYMIPSGGGTAELPVFRFIGGMADATDWTTWDYPVAPVACLRQAVGVQPTYNDGSPCHGANDDSVLFAASDWYEAPDNVFGHIATEDAVIESIFKVGPNTVAMSGSRTTGVGWMQYSTGGTSVKFMIQDASGSTTITAVGQIVGTWIHTLIFLDRTGFGQIYINGLASGAAVDISGRQLTLEIAQACGFGSRATGSIPFTSNIAYFAMWKKAAWLTTHLNPVTAAARFGRVAGFLPQFFRGSSVPNTATRSYPAYLDKIEGGKSRIYPVGAEWLRICHRKDSAGTDIYGYLPEIERENDIDEGNDWTAWTKEDAGDVVADDAFLAPNNEVSMGTIICDNTNGNHGLRYATPGNLSVDHHCFSTWVGTGNATWWKLEDTTVANAHAWFNLATGVVGTVGAGASAAGFVENEDTGEYVGTGTNVRRLYIRFTGTVAPHTMRIRPCDGDTVDTFSAGDGAAVTGYLFGAQVEKGDYPSSLIDTDGATAIRLADELQFAGLSNVGGSGSEGRGTYTFDLLTPDHDRAIVPYLLSISDGGAAADRISLLIGTGGDVPKVDMRATAGNAGDADGTTDIDDGVVHNIRVTWTKDNLRLVVDGVQEAQDVVCDVPDDLDEIDIGSNASGNNQPQGLISNLKIWRRVKY